MRLDTFTATYVRWAAGCYPSLCAPAPQALICALLASAQMGVHAPACPLPSHLRTQDSLTLSLCAMVLVCRYTSEDAVSFNGIISEEIARKRAK